MALETKIKCNGIKPTKAEVYTLAAELVDLEDIEHFYRAIIEAFKSYDYYEYYDYAYNYDYTYDYEYYDYEYYDYYYDYDYDYSKEEKVLALLFLAAMYSTPEIGN